MVDLGYRGGASPTNNKNAVVTITDKNKKKCTMLNNDLNKINKDEVELIYKNNEDLHKFLSKKCPNLDISDLLKPTIENLQATTKPKKLGAAPAVEDKSVKENDSKREAKKAYEYDTMEDLLKDIDRGALQK